MALLLIVFGDEGREWVVDEGIDYDLSDEEVRDVVTECAHGEAIYELDNPNNWLEEMPDEMWINDSVIHRSVRGETGEVVLLRPKVAFGS